MIKDSGGVGVFVCIRLGLPKIEGALIAAMRSLLPKTLWLLRIRGVETFIPFENLHVENGIFA